MDNCPENEECEPISKLRRSGCCVCSSGFSRAPNETFLLSASQSLELRKEEPELTSPPPTATTFTGNYTFKLTVPDRDGETISTTASIEVIQETDYPPEANDGSPVVQYFFGRQMKLLSMAIRALLIMVLHCGNGL